MKSGWHHGWNIVVVSLLFQALSNGTIISSFGLFMPLWSKDFGISHSTTTLFLTASVILSGFAAVVIGRLFDVVSVKLTILVGCALYIASFLLLSIATEPWQLFLVYSIALSLTFVLLDALPAQVLVARWFGREASVPLSIATSGMAIGGVLVPPVVAFLVAEAHGWRTACTVLAVVMAVLVVPLILLVVRDRPAAAVEGGASAARGHGKVSLSESVAIAADPHFYWAMLAAVPLLMMTTAFQTNVGAIVLARGGTLGDASFYLAVLNALGFVATVSAGWMLKRAQHRALFQIGAAVSAIGVLGFYFAGQSPMLPLFSAMIGLGTGAASSIIAAYFCLAFTPARMGTTMGVALFFSRIVILAPLLFAVVSEHSGSFTVPMIGLAIFGLLTVAAASRMPTVMEAEGRPEPALA